MKVDTDREYVAERDWRPRRGPVERSRERVYDVPGLLVALATVFAVMGFGVACYLYFSA